MSHDSASRALLLSATNGHSGLCGFRTFVGTRGHLSAAERMEMATRSQWAAMR